MRELSAAHVYFMDNDEGDSDSSSCHSSNIENGIVYQDIKSSSDVEEALDFVCDLYFKDEPLSQMLAMSADEIAAEERRIIKIDLSRETSLVAFDANTGEICGVAVNECPLSQSNLDEIENPTAHEKCAMAARFIDLVGSELQWFSDPIFYVDIVVVNPMYRRRKICSKLIQRSEKLAFDLGYKVIAAVTTSKYSKELFLRLNYQSHTEVNYCDYVDAVTKQKPFIDPPAPHYSAALVIKRLAPTSEEAYVIPY